jgi:hypothetical protein
VHELALKIDADAARDLKGDFESFATKDGDTDESVRGALQNGNFADDLSKIGVVCATLALTIGELDPARQEWARAVESLRPKCWTVRGFVTGRLQPLSAGP